MDVTALPPSTSTGMINFARARLRGDDLVRRVQSLLARGGAVTAFDITGNAPLTRDEMRLLAHVLVSAYGAAAGAPPMRSLRLADLGLTLDSVPAVVEILRCEGIAENAEGVTLGAWGLSGASRFAFTITASGVVPLPTPAPPDWSKPLVYASLAPLAMSHLMGALHACRNLQALSLRSCEMDASSLPFIAPLLLLDLKELDLSHNAFWVPKPTPAPPRAPKSAGSGRPAPSARRPPGGTASGGGAGAAPSSPRSTPTSPRSGAAAAASDGAGAIPLDDGSSDDWFRSLRDLAGKAVSSFGDAVMGGVRLSRPACVFAAALMSQFTRLQNLDLSHCSMSDEAALPMVAALADSVSLQFLDISHNRLTSTSAVVLAASIAVNTSLRELRCGFQPLGQEGTRRILAALRENGGLTLLCVENTYLDGTEGEARGAAGVTAVGGAARLTAPSAPTPPLSATPLGPKPAPTSLFAAAAALSKSQPAVVRDLWSVVDVACERRPVYCRVVLEFPERPRLHAGALRALDFDEEDVDDGLAWLRGEDKAPRARKWSLDRSVWAKRATEADSHDFYDTQAVLARAFETDWAQTKLHRVIKDSNDRAAVKPILKLRYGLLREIFRYYASVSGSPFALSFSQYTEMRKTMRLDAPGRTAELDMTFFSAESGADRGGGGSLGHAEGAKGGGLARAASFVTPSTARGGGGGGGGSAVTGLAATARKEGGGGTGSTAGLTKVRSFVAGAGAGSTATLTAGSARASPVDDKVVTTAAPSNALMRHELLEAFVRLAVTFYAPRPDGAKTPASARGAAGAPLTSRTAASHASQATSATGPSAAGKGAAATGARSVGGSTGLAPGDSTSSLGGASGAAGDGGGLSARSDGSDSEDEGGEGAAAASSPVVEAVRRAVEDHLVPTVAMLLSIPPGHLDDAYSNLFRRHRLYTEAVDDVLRRFEPLLWRVFIKYKEETTVFLQVGGWMSMLSRLGAFDGSLAARVDASAAASGAVSSLSASSSSAALAAAASAPPPGAGAGSGAVTARGGRADATARRAGAAATTTASAAGAITAKGDFTERDARLLFLMSIMTVVDEVQRQAKAARVSNHTSLTFTGFMEAFCRLADSAICPRDVPWDMPRPAPPTPSLPALPPTTAAAAMAAAVAGSSGSGAAGAGGGAGAAASGAARGDTSIRRGSVLRPTRASVVGARRGAGAADGAAAGGGDAAAAAVSATQRSVMSAGMVPSGGAVASAGTSRTAVTSLTVATQRTETSVTSGRPPGAPGPAPPVTIRKTYGGGARVRHTVAVRTEAGKNTTARVSMSEAGPGGPPTTPHGSASVRSAGGASGPITPTAAAVASAGAAGASLADAPASIEPTADGHAGTRDGDSAAAAPLLSPWGKPPPTPTAPAAAAAAIATASAASMTPADAVGVLSSPSSPSRRGTSPAATASSPRAPSRVGVPALALHAIHGGGEGVRSTAAISTVSTVPSLAGLPAPASGTPAAAPSGPLILPLIPGLPPGKATAPASTAHTVGASTTAGAKAAAVSGKSALAAATPATTAAASGGGGPPRELHERLEIMLVHLAAAEGISIKGIERKYR